MSDRTLAACLAFADYARDTGECAVCGYAAAECDTDYASGEDCCLGAVARAAVGDVGGDVRVTEIQTLASITQSADDPHVAVRLPGVLVARYDDVSARALRDALDRLLEQVGARRVSVVITSLEPL